MNDELAELFDQIRKRLADLPEGSCARKSLQEHVRALAQWHSEPMDYPEVADVEFPPALPVAYAVCHPDCGSREFIVDGGTQTCEHCGRKMFRTEIAQYKLENKDREQ